MSATIKLTRTMLDKHIIDANASVRSWALDAYGIDYASLREKVEVNAYVNGVATKVRFYVTARGDQSVDQRRQAHRKRRRHRHPHKGDTLDTLYSTLYI